MVQEWEKIKTVEQKELKEFCDFNSMSIFDFFTEKKNFRRKIICGGPVIVNNPALSN